VEAVVVSHEGGAEVTTERKRKGFIKTESLTKPPRFYSTNLPVARIRVAMRDGEWMTVDHLCAVIGDEVTPEAKLRTLQLCRGSVAPAKSWMEMERNLRKGLRKLVQMKLSAMKHDGEVEKDGKGKDARYRWIEKQDVAGIADSA
jgi:hypothetical protein